MSLEGIASGSGVSFVIRKRIVLHSQMRNIIVFSVYTVYDAVRVSVSQTKNLTAEACGLEVHALSRILGQGKETIQIVVYQFLPLLENNAKNVLIIWTIFRTV